MTPCESISGEDDQFCLSGLMLSTIYLSAKWLFLDNKITKSSISLFHSSAFSFCSYFWLSLSFFFSFLSCWWRRLLRGCFFYFLYWSSFNFFWSHLFNLFGFLGFFYFCFLGFALRFRNRFLLLFFCLFFWSLEFACFLELFFFFELLLEFRSFCSLLLPL